MVSVKTFFVTTDMRLMNAMLSSTTIVYQSVTCDCGWKGFYAFRKDNNYNNKKKVWAFLYGIVQNSYFSWDNAIWNQIYLYFSISSSIRNSGILSLVHRIFLLRVVIHAKAINSSRNIVGDLFWKNSALSIYLRYYTRKYVMRVIQVQIQ